MDLNVAIQKHAEWKFKFRNAIFSNETMDAAAIAKDNNCEFGKWLHGEGKALYGQSPRFAICVAGHAAFHVEAGRIAAAINAKKSGEAEKMIAAGSAFSEASKKVSLAIVELGQDVHAHR